MATKSVGTPQCIFMLFIRSVWPVHVGLWWLLVLRWVPSKATLRTGAGRALCLHCLGTKGVFEIMGQTGVPALTYLCPLSSCENNALSERQLVLFPSNSVLLPFTPTRCFTWCTPPPPPPPPPPPKPPQPGGGPPAEFTPAPCSPRGGGGGDEAEMAKRQDLILASPPCKLPLPAPALTVRVGHRAVPASPRLLPPRVVGDSPVRGTTGVGRVSTGTSLSLGQKAVPGLVKSPGYGAPWHPTTHQLTSHTDVALLAQPALAHVVPVPVVRPFSRCAPRWGTGHFVWLRSWYRHH